MDQQKPYVLFPISDWDIANHELGVLLRLFLAECILHIVLLLVNSISSFGHHT